MSAVLDDIVGLLGRLGAPARAARSGDEVAGVRPAVVAQPTDTASTAAVLRLAAERDLAVVARGTGTKLGWGGSPGRLDLVIETSRMDRVIEHAAGDLVVHVQAGITFAALQGALSSAGQRLALDPLTDPDASLPGTVGGVLATGADGPLRQSHGAPRDLLIGITIVRADGVVAKAGGKVVKNVAGYDLGKLVTGSWGTLGVITAAIFRLHPVPETGRWVMYSGPDASERAHAVVHSQTVPTAVEIDRPAGGSTTVAVLVEGVASGVEARVKAIRDILGGGAVAAVATAAPAWWGRAPWAPGGTALRLTTTQTGVGALLAALDALALPVSVRGSAGVGKLHAGLPRDAEPAAVARCVEALREQRAAWGGDVVVLDAPPAVREAVDLWGPVSGLALMRRIKREFDPEHRLAPGRFVGGS